MQSKRSVNDRVACRSAVVTAASALWIAEDIPSAVPSAFFVLALVALKAPNDPQTLRVDRIQVARVLRDLDRFGLLASLAGRVGARGDGEGDEGGDDPAHRFGVAPEGREMAEQANSGVRARLRSVG